MKTKAILASAYLAALGLLLAPATATAAERADAKVTCTKTGKNLVYDCMIMLTGRKSKQPLTGAQILINADMPSMAMAHNVKPVKTTPAGKPGMYRAKLKLEMHGEWALKLKISGPTRDIVIRKIRFGAADSADHGAHKMKPGDMKKDGMKMDDGHKKPSN